MQILVSTVTTASEATQRLLCHLPRPPSSVAVVYVDHDTIPRTHTQSGFSGAQRLTEHRVR